MSSNHASGFWPVVAAVAGNAFVSVIKFIAAFASGSSAMFSEAVHSVADTSNQVLLLLGISRSRKKADEEFSYGYGRERFFWALLSACGIFFVGAGVTVYRGIISVLEPEPVDLSSLVFGVLLISFIVEAFTFFVALQELRRSSPTLSWRERLVAGDPSTLAVLLEDGIAVLGVIIAAVAIGLSFVTGNHAWDAAGSITIGCLLGIAAVLLIVKNRTYLIGKAIPEELRDEVVALLVADPAIERVLDFKSMTLDVGVYRVKCEVEINGHALLDDYFRESLEGEFEDMSGDYEAFKRFAVAYADRIPRLIGTRIDELEADIQAKHPSIRHIDIEVN
ncbi:cation diffusion facilitator family transporter [Candidatus Uhrbacteria bacterium]|nr:cation diffusion facilitator family transporter [Candidatus Uhrbacteria bacterium]